MQGSIAIHKGSAAWGLISDPRFLIRWQELFDACPWATSFQSPGFVCSWFEHYQNQFSPVLIVQAAGERINALMILGHSASMHKLVAAGGYQAEYQVWLEQPNEQQGNFIGQALQAIAFTYPRHELAFRYIPGEMPLMQLEGPGKLIRRIALNSKPRRYTLLDHETIERIFVNKRNHRSLKSLSKLGDLQFRRIHDTEQLASIFDEIITFYDFRQCAVHGRFPFLQDTSKKRFHLDLLKNCPELLHVTVTTLDGNVLAAHIGVLSKNQIHLGIIAYSPFYAHYSPGIVHLMFLCQHLLHEGITHFDLTPGDDPTKERFANRCDQVYRLTLHRDRQTCQVARLKAKGYVWAKETTRTMGLSPEKAKALFAHAKRFRVTKAGLELLGIIWEKSETRVYLSVGKKAIPPPEYCLLNKDHLDDLIRYEPTNRRSSKQTFMLEAMKRLARNEHFYTYVVADRLIFCCWISEQVGERFLPEIQQIIRFQGPSVVLENFYCHPGSIGQELFQYAIEQILSEVSKPNHDQRIFILISGHDHLASHVFKSQGLEDTGLLHLQRVFGITRRWKSDGPIQGKWLAMPFSQDL